VKVKKKGHSCEKEMWEIEEKIRERYHYLFNKNGKCSSISVKFRQQNFDKVGECNIFKRKI
jgi:hypothetical protein